MEIRKDFVLNLQHDRIVSAIFQDRVSDPCWLQKVRETIQFVEPFLKPAAISAWFSVDRTDATCVWLRGQDRCDVVRLDIGPHVDLLADAEHVLCCVATLGAGLDARLAILKKSSDLLRAYLADCIAIYALLEVSRTLYRQVEEFAAASNWGVGSVMSPGAIGGWLLEEQQKLCSMLPIEQIGVRINGSGVLSPPKSVSFIIGAGGGYETGKVGIPCGVCTNTGTCWCTY